MNLSSLFSRASAPDLQTQVKNNCERQIAKIVHTINNEERGTYRFEITRQRVAQSSAPGTNFYIRGEAMVAAEEALRCSAAYAELHDICMHPANNCHIEYASEYLHGKKSVVSYVVIDTTKPYSTPHLPVGENAAPSTIFHNEYTDDEVTQYDDDGIPIPPSLYTDEGIAAAKSNKTADAGARDATATPVITGTLTAPKVTFKKATA